jgi:xylan 1,4-beta-xylosidase
LLHQLGTERLLVDGLHETVDAWVVRRGMSVTALLTNHALPRYPIQSEHVSIHLSGAPEPRKAYAERIDKTHANAKRAWRELGEPEYLSASDIELLEAASRIVREPQAWKYENQTVHLDIVLPPHAVAAITVEFV